MQTYNLSGTVYAALRVANTPGGYITHGKTVQEAIAKALALAIEDERTKPYQPAICLE